MNRISKAAGVHFAPDNHIVPIIRLGKFHRVETPGYFWIRPFIEKTLPPISIGLQIGKFTFSEVLSQDNIPFSISMTVLFQFNPQLPSFSTLAQIVRLPSKTFQTIVRDYANQGLRRLTSEHNAIDLAGHKSMFALERDLTRHLRLQLRPLGLSPIKNGGVLIKEVIAPERFSRTMLAVQQHQTTLKLLSAYQGDSLVEQALHAQFLMGIEGHKGDLNLWSSLDRTQIPIPYASYLSKTDRKDKKSSNGSANA